MNECPSKNQIDRAFFVVPIKKGARERKVVRCFSQLKCLPILSSVFLRKKRNCNAHFYICQKYLFSFFVTLFCFNFATCGDPAKIPNHKRCVPWFLSTTDEIHVKNSYFLLPNFFCPPFLNLIITT